MDGWIKKTGWHSRSVRLIVAVICSAFASFQTSGRSDNPTIRVSTLSSRDLPAEFDSATTYHYVFVCSNPESLITELWNGDVRVWQAWMPLDNMCMGPVGPQFTVQLQEEDPDILDFNFAPGDGRLHCATSLKRFIVSE